MKTPTALRLLGTVLLGAAASSCTVYDPEVYGNYPVSGGGGGYAARYDAPPPRLAPHGYISTGYSTSFGSHPGHRDDDYYRAQQSRSQRPGSDSNRDVDKDRLRIVGGDLDGMKKPKGEHSLDWYHDRGFDFKKVKLEDSDGDRYKSQSKSSSNNKKDDDDDDKKSGGGNRPPPSGGGGNRPPPRR